MNRTFFRMDVEANRWDVVGHLPDKSMDNYHGGKNIVIGNKIYMPTER